MRQAEKRPTATTRIPFRAEERPARSAPLAGGRPAGVSALVERARHLSDSALDALLLAGSLLFGAAFTLFLVVLVKVVPPLLLGPEGAL